MAKSVKQTGLAAALGVSQPMLVEWMRDPEWTWGKGPWTPFAVKRIQAWRDGKSREAAAGITGNESDDQANAIRSLRLNPEKAARVQLIIERTVGQRMANKQTADKLVDRDEVERERTERVEAVKAAMQALVNTLPPKLVGLGAAAMEPVLLAEFRAVCNGFANG